MPFPMGFVVRYGAYVCHRCPLLDSLIKALPKDNVAKPLIQPGRFTLKGLGARCQDHEQAFVNLIRFIKRPNANSEHLLLAFGAWNGFTASRHVSAQARVKKIKGNR